MHRLAASLGKFVWEVEMLSAQEWNDWQEYQTLEPFGAMRENLHTGMVAAMVANFSGRLKKGKWLKPEDFLLRDAETVRKQKTRHFISELKRRSKPKAKA